VSADTASPELRDHFKHGLEAPICLTWEVTYGCNLACAHCLSSSGKRDPRELSTEECRSLIDELARMRVFYVNVGGGEPLVRRDFLDLVDHAVERKVGVKFSTNGALITEEAAARIAATDYLDVQISIDGATPETNDPVRGRGSYALARRGMDRLAEAGLRPFKISVVVTRHNIPELDAPGADRRRLRRSAADHPAAPLGPRRLGVGRAAPHGDPAARAVRVADRATGRAHRGLVLPSFGARRAAARTEPVRCGAGGVPGRPGRRRLRLPVRAARRVPRR
jgi:uncharacterized Fe-S cluster-containing radical SAM superfamily protein